MKPGVSKTSITLAILAGLIITQSCGSGGYSSDFSSGTGNTGGVTITNEVDSPAEMNVGDIMMLQFGSSGTAELDFTGVDEDSQYYLVVGSLESTFKTHSVSIESSLSDMELKAFGRIDGEVEEWRERSMIEVFHQRLDDLGLAMALDDNEQIAEPDLINAKYSRSDKSVSVGDYKRFRVLNSLTSMSSYAEVTAEAKCVKENVIYYVDVEVERENPNDLTDDDIEMLCENFSQQVELEQSWYGEGSDVNGDNKYAVLSTPKVNELGAMGGGIITGYFLASDLYDRSDTNKLSNEMEIVYTLVPDSAGRYGVVIPKTFGIENLMTAVIPHELQHAINYGERVITQGFSPELSWFNEAESHFTEDRVGYGQENYSRMGIFLDSPPSYQLVASGSPNLGERGASYMFLRFLFEQHPNPDQFIWNLYHTNATGVANIEASFNGTEENFDQFGEFFMRWMSALAMTNRGLSADTRYVFQPRVFNEETQRWQGVCLICEADDGRGTVLTGPDLTTYSGAESLNIYSSTMQFYDISSVPDKITFNANGVLGAVLVRKQ